MAALAQEVRKMDNLRTKAILAWCDNIETTIKSCGADVAKQRDQAAGATSEIVLELNRIEEMRENTFPHYHSTVLNEGDKIVPQYFYRPDFEKREIVLSAVAYDVVAQKKDPQWTLDSIVIPMREDIR